MKNRLKAYESVSVTAELLEADPHRVIQMLMEGFLSRLNAAKGYIERRNYQEKTNCINKSIEILNGLLVSLDMEKGGEIAQVLKELYHFMLQQLVKANMKNDPMLIDNVKSLMQNVKDGWDAIPQDIKEKHASELIHSNESCVE